MKFITVFSDASFHSSGHAGYAYFLRDHEVVVKEAHSLPWKAKQSTDVEEFAMCHAIIRAIDTIPFESGDEIVAQTDSGDRQCSQGVEQARPVSQIQHVRAHTGKEDKRSYVNRWCDVSARNEMRRSRASV